MRTILGGEMMKKFNRKIKEWMRTHEDAVQLIVTSTGVVAVLGLVLWRIRIQLEQQAEYYETVNEALAEGKSILPGPNGTVWILPSKESEKGAVS
jgi:predicted phage tail protein